MMRNRTPLHVALTTLATLTLGGLAEAANPTTITVPDMHCMMCVKKIVAQMQAVPGVANVQTNMPAAAVTVVAKDQPVPSPKALWEAVEKAGFKPTRLEGPNGTFTAKPQF